MEKHSYLFSQCQSDLQKHGYCLDFIQLPNTLKEMVKSSDYKSIDEYIWNEIEPGGLIHSKLSQYIDFSSIEFIISLRKEDNEDGIWHDDGSRVLAFSLSLTFEKPMAGGVLEIRKKGESQAHKIETPNFGEMIIFKTGVDQYEHKINKVKKGSRLVIAGWCYR